ncbi:MAG: hypothetical protein RL150_490 [Candidatus Parcubacteria bacterium]
MTLIKSPKASFGAHGFTIPAWGASQGKLHYTRRDGPIGRLSVPFPDDATIKPFQEGAYDCIMREFEISRSFNVTLAEMDQLGYGVAMLTELDFFDQQFGTASDRIRMALRTPVAFQGRNTWFAGSFLAVLGEPTAQPAVTLVSWKAVETGRRAYMQDERRYTLLGVRRLLN